MLRTVSAVPRTVLDKMRYTVPERVADWTKRFSGKLPEAALPRKPARKVPAKKTAAKKAAPAALSKPRLKTAKPATMPEPAGRIPAKPAPVFIKKEPVTFQLRRLERPADFERAAFVIKACATDPRHKALTVLHVEQTREGSWLVASDGKRLHAALIPAKIKSGDYKPVATKETISLGEPVTGIMFPNWRRVIPSAAIRRGTIDLAEAGWGKDRKQTEKLSVAFNDFVRQTGALVNLRYLEDLAKKRWSVHCQRERNKAIMLKAEGETPDMVAVIMPLAGEAEAKAA